MLLSRNKAQLSKYNVRFEQIQSVAEQKKVWLSKYKLFLASAKYG